MSDPWLRRIAFTLILFLTRVPALAGQCTETIGAGETQSRLVGTKSFTTLAVIETSTSEEYVLFTWALGVYELPDGTWIVVDCGDYVIQPL